MGTTNFYMGSLRYGPTGKKRKNHAANPVRKKRPVFRPMKIDPIRAKAAQEAAERRQQEKEDFLNRLKNMNPNATAKKQKMEYSGERKLIGIATMHKSNAVPIFEHDKEHAKDIARMRR